MLLDRLHRPVRGVRLVHRSPNQPDEPARVQIVPLRKLDRSEVERVMAQLADTPGYVVTAALSSREQEPFLAAGFTPRESLYLLKHDLENIARPKGPCIIRNARRSDLGRVLEIDRQGFDDFWVFDRDALIAARRATPKNRYVVATLDQQIVGYAVSGHAGMTSFLQRLGVATEARRQGVGSQLILDALLWAQKVSGLAMFVNTQEINTTALQVYERHGFGLDDERLTVLEWQR